MKHFESYDILKEKYTKLQEKYKSLAEDYYDLHFKHEKLEEEYLKELALVRKLAEENAELNTKLYPCKS